MFSEFTLLIEPNRCLPPLFSSLEATDGPHGQDKTECRYRPHSWLLHLCGGE